MNSQFEGFVNDYSSSRKQIEEKVNAICGFNVNRALNVIWIIGSILSIAGLYIFKENASYQQCFLYILLPLILLRFIDILTTWMIKDIRE
jgi:hypothetical protein